MQKVIDLWQVTDFRLVPHAAGQVSIVAGADDIVALLEESQVRRGVRVGRGWGGEGGEKRGTVGRRKGARGGAT